jgi:RHS repeat-associated protein
VRRLDPTGRVLGENVTPAPASFGIPDATMTFDADNRLTNFNGQAVSFDADGNMTQGPSAITLNAIAYSYDARNRLTSAGNLTDNYNPDGRRTALSDATVNPNGVSSSFVIDPSARLDRVLVRNEGGNATYYVYGLGLTGQEQNGAYSQYHFDSRGSTVALTDANGNVTDRFEYDSYGTSLAHTGTSDTPFQFNGRVGVQTDSNGLLYMRARYYNPAIRRFVNQDVLFGDLNPGISLNRFALANGNPISLLDPFGLCAQDDQFYGTGLYGAINRELNEAANFINPLNATSFWGIGGRAIETGLAQFGTWFEQTTGVPSGALGPEFALAAPVSASSELVELGAAEGTTAVRVGDYTLTDTVSGHLGERVGGVVEYSGSLSRPYLQSPSTINEIIATGKGVPDPGGLSGALRYDVPGAFRGSAGNWELVVDPNSQTIYHFNFTTGH